MNASTRIKLARRRSALSQIALAASVGVQRSAVSHWESPQGKNPTVQHLRRLAEVTKVQFEWLATGRGPMALSKEAVLESIPAAHALLVEDDLEMRFIRAFRALALESRLSLVEIAEQMAWLRNGRNQNPALPRRGRGG